MVNVRPQYGCRGVSGSVPISLHRNCVFPLYRHFLSILSSAEPYFPFFSRYGPQHPCLRRLQRRSSRQGPCQHSIQPVFYGNDSNILLFSRRDHQERHRGWFFLLLPAGLLVLYVYHLICPAPGPLEVNNRNAGFIRWCSLLYRNHENFFFGSPSLDWSEQVVVITGGSSALFALISCHNKTP